MNRREWLLTAAGASAALAQDYTKAPLGERPPQAPGVSVLNPRARVPVGLIIDDSTCLVNLNRFAIPQFAQAHGRERYGHDWRSMPHEIPDSFVRRFADWCDEHGVKGKYSIVPMPACVGRVDRLLPGWTRQQLLDSLDLVRTRMLPNWDIHPEMISHTRLIDIRTGHPYPQTGPDYMENSAWNHGGSVSELADYMAYALRILRNVDLPCEGITTPGGMALGAVPELAQATLQVCRDLFQTETPHYFKFLTSSGPDSVAPRVEWAAGLGGPSPECIVNIIGCTGDWTGGWDCRPQPMPDRFITRDLESGRMVEVIERGEPAMMFGHWTGFYFNGHEFGFQAFQEAVRRLQMRYDNLIWMKLNELARYWAARELTAIQVEGKTLTLNAPFACPDFTLNWKAAPKPLALITGGNRQPLTEVNNPKQLKSGTWTAGSESITACINLPKGNSQLTT